MEHEELKAHLLKEHKQPHMDALRLYVDNNLKYWSNLLSMIMVIQVAEQVEKDKKETE